VSRRAGRSRPLPVEVRLSSVALLALALLLAACSATPRPELLRRFATFEVSDTAGLVEVSAFAMDAAGGPAGLPVLELSRSAQAELVEAVAARTSSPEALLRALGAPASDAAGAAGVVDRTRFRRRVVISAENHALRPRESDGGEWLVRPAGRISRLRVTVALADSSRAAFRSWDRFASRHETVDLGRMSFTRERDRGLEVGLRPAAAEGSVDRIGLSAGPSTRLDEELTLRHRYGTTGTLRSGSMTLLQEGAVGVDLTGNSAVEVEIDVTDAPHRRPILAFDGLFTPAGVARPPDSVRVSSRELLFAADATRDVVGRLTFEAVVRTVRPGAGEATWAEGDDAARYLVEAGEGGEVRLIAARELRVSVWQLATPGCRRFLHVDDGVAGSPAVLQVGSAEEAFGLLRWLRRSGSPEVGRRTLYLGPEERLAAADVERLGVRLAPLNWEAGAGCP